MKSDVQRCRTRSNYVRRSEVHDDASLFQCLADAIRVLMFDGDVTAASFRISGHPDATLGYLVHQSNEIIGEVEGLLAHGFDSHLLERFERPPERCGDEHRNRSDLLRARAIGGRERRVHLELRLLVVTPPAGESGSRSEVALVDVRPRHRARPGVQALVATPDGEIDAPLRDVVWHDLHRVRDVESGQRVVCAGRSSESFHIDQLAAP